MAFQIQGPSVPAQAPSFKADVAKNDVIKDNTKKETAKSADSQKPVTNNDTTTEKKSKFEEAGKQIGKDLFGIGKREQSFAPASAAAPVAAPTLENLTQDVTQKNKKVDDNKGSTDVKAPVQKPRESNIFESAKAASGTENNGAAEKVAKELQKNLFDPAKNIAALNEAKAAQSAAAPVAPGLA